MAHQYQFLLHGLQVFADVDAGTDFPAPFSECLRFLLAFAEKENPAFGIFGKYLVDDLAHQAWRIDFALVGGKGGDAQPFLVAVLGADDGGEQVEIATLRTEDGGELRGDGVAQFGEDIQVVLEGGGLLHQFLVVEVDELLLAFAVLVDMSHLVVAQVEPEAQILRAQYVMKVGHGGELLCRESSEQGVQAFQPFVFLLHVGFHEIDIGSQVLEKRTGEGAAEHCDAQVGIVLCQGIDYGYSHGYIAESREPYDEDMVFLHFFL